jgi:hypothetical protein
MTGWTVRIAKELTRKLMLNRWYFLAILGAAFTLLSAPPGHTQELTKSGTVTIEQVQVAFVGSGNLGGGALEFGGQTYRFKIGGLGVGGIGVSKIHATGQVYNLTDLAYFPGAYVQARIGFAVGELSGGELWLKNSHGVVLQLKAERKGLALSLGGDAIYIRLE